MKKWKLYAFVVVVFIIFQGSFIYIFQGLQTKEINHYIETQRNNFVSTYNTIFNTYSNLPRIIFDGTINNTSITSSLYKVHFSKDLDTRNKIREELYNRLKDTYKTTLIDSGFKELAFYLENGETFLRFSHPNIYGDNLKEQRFSLKEIKNAKKNLEGFESDKFFNGYRYIYPLFYKNSFIGSAEIVLDIETYLNIASKALNGEQRFIIRQDMIEKSSIKESQQKYLRSCLNSHYLFQKHEDLPMFDLLSSLPEDKKNIISEKLKGSENFSLPVKLKNKNLITNFMPIFDIQKRIIGFIVGVQEADAIDHIYTSFLKNISFSFVFALLILSALIGYLKEKFLLKEIVKINETLEDKVKQRTNELSHNTKLLETIIETVPTPLFYKGVDGKYITCNDEFLKLTNVNKKTLIGSVSEDIFPKEIAKQFVKIDQHVLEKQTKQKFETTMQLNDGQKREVEIYKNFITQDGKAKGIIGLLYDISELKHYQRQLENDYDIIQKYTIYTKMDTNYQIIEVSKGFCDFLGYSEDEVKKMRHFELQRKKIDDPVYQEIRKTIQEGKVWKGEFLNYTKDGSKVWSRTTVSPEFNIEGKIEGFITFSQDISREKIIQEHSYKDELTNLYNRKKFNEELIYSMSLHERYKDDTSLILFDIDKFKAINDIHGHLVGDKILVELSNIVSSNIRECDTLARWGGEEFTLILPKTNKENAIKIAKKLREKIIAHDFGIGHCITCSFGVTSYKENDSTTSIIKRVDDMLYKAKNEGRDKIIYD
jgi:diguanylate cyclase (GGDEF)-like protein/PAS domain S-box-containing protein